MSENKKEEQKGKEEAQSQGNESASAEGQASPGADSVDASSKEKKSDKKAAPAAKKSKLKVQLYIGKDSLKAGTEIDEKHPHFAYCKGADLLEPV